MASASFVYEALSTSSGHTRVFVLHPGAHEDEIRGHLLQVPLPAEIAGHAPCRSWTALSYSWGAATIPFNIRVDGKVFVITEKLHTALKFLRSSTESRTLWIDQICVNQLSNDERGCQVLLMDRIFSQAEEVTCWLFGPSDSFYQLLDLLSVTRHDAVTDYLQLKHDAYTTDDRIWENIYRKIQGISPTTPLPAEETARMFDVLRHLMKLDWFHRVWTIQEAVLARKLSFQVGDKKFPAEALENLLEMLRVSGHSSLSSVHTGGLVKPASIFALRHLYTKGNSHQIDPPVLLDSSKHRGVTDDRDRVFGLLGLLNMALGMHFPAVSYHQPVEETYMQMTIELIELDNSPDPIKFCCAQRSKSQYDTPSWSEDWSVHTGCGAQSARSMLKRPRIYHAASAEPFSYRYIPEARMLILPGTIIGTIEKVVKPGGHLDNSGQVWAEWLSLSGDDNHLEVICRTLVADQNTEDTAFSRASPDFVQQLVEWARSVDPANISTSLDRLHRRFPRACSRIKDALRLFSLFTTSNGIVGQSCKHVEPGDRLCLLNGGKLPFVLRDAGPTQVDGSGARGDTGDASSREHQLIGGECFVWELADGQGNAFAKARGYQTQDVRLV